MENEEIKEKEEIKENKKVTKKSKGESRSESSNVVARKFSIIVFIIKLIGYSAATIAGLVTAGMIMSTGDEAFIWGLLAGFLVGFVIVVITWLSTLTLEATAENLNLLQDIKNSINETRNND